MKYKYTMRFDIKKLVALITNASKAPDEVGRSGMHTYTFTFKNTDVTLQERIDVFNALPEWMRLLYSFDREVLPDDPTP